MKITVLIENCITSTRPRALKGEHGLAMFIEFPDYKLLLDTGQTDQILENTELLNVPLARANAIVISHGHYDHAGGLAAVLFQVNRLIDVYIHPAAFKERQAVREGCSEDIGIPATPQDFHTLGARFTDASRPTEIYPHLWVSGEVPRCTDFEHGDSSFCCLDEEGNLQPDAIEDDLSLYYASRQGLVVITGCAHAGLINIIEWGKKVTGLNRVFGIIGGTHLGPAKAGQRARTLALLEEMNPAWIAANHCTGSFQYDLKRVFGDRFTTAAVGYTLEIE